MSLPWHLAAFTSGVLGLALLQSPGAASAPAATGGFDQMTAEELKTAAASLMAQAKASPSGSASETLKKYPGHFTMLTVRLKSGGAEQHDQMNDFFFVLSGEATEMIGGTIENSKTSSPGELRGTRVVGGVEHVMRAGDIVHIAPGTPHQTLVAPGQSFTYFVVKVQQ